MTTIETIRKLELRVATLEKTLARKEMALRIASIKLAEKSAVEVFKKIAPSYKNKKTKRQVSWYTAYQNKDHPSHKQAVADYQKWVSKNTGKALTEKMKKERKKAGKTLETQGKVIAEKSWSGFKKKFLEGAKDELKDFKKSAGIIGRMTGITKDDDGNKYDFKNKEQLKKDMKTVWGSAVYFAGAAVAVYTGAGAATIAMDFGKSVATHALLKTISPDKGKGNFDSGPFSFLSLEAAETVSKAIGKGDSVLWGGLKSTDLFDGIVKAIGSGISNIASEDEETDEDKAMVEFLGKINEAVGKAMQEMSDEEIDALS